MIHFHWTFSNDPLNTPFGKRLSEIGVGFTMFARTTRYKFKSRIGLIVFGRSKTLLFALSAAVRSLILSKPVPRVIVVWTHLEAVVVGIVRAVLRRRRTKIVLVGFILTARRGALHNWLRNLYFRWVFSLVDLVVVHSQIEVIRYSAIYRNCRSRFIYIPWGSHIADLEKLIRERSTAGTSGRPDVVAAGRSGRDYSTLFEALKGTSFKANIICDRSESTSGSESQGNINVLTDCYGIAYLRQISMARCVAIPLTGEDISAGQMVLLQAMELGKPIVITRTSTTVDYVADEHDALMVEPGDAVALRTALERVLSDPAYADLLGRNAEATFRARFTMPVFVDNLVRGILAMDPEAGSA